MTDPPRDVSVERRLDTLFRRKWPELMLVLTRRFGAGQLDEIEDALQGAAIKALELWQRRMPANPAAWILAVAHNALLDRQRRIRRAGRLEGRVADLYAHDETDRHGLWLGPLEDDVMKMMLVCAHASLSSRESLVITLRLVSGLSIGEIARALVSSEAAAKKLFTRAKTRIREAHVPFELPAAPELDSRLDRVLRCIYLVFNEGYSASAGANAVRRDLCNEAQRLVDLLLASALGEHGEIAALGALLAFQASRLPSRVDAEGRPVLLEHQDRRLWDRALIAKGTAYLARSMSSRERSRYHLEAAIAACHATVDAYEKTDWNQIREFYDDLIELAPSPVAELNRSVAVLMTEGPEAAIAALEPLERTGRLGSMYLLPALLADYHRRAGEVEQAKLYYRRALDLVQTTPIREHLTARLEACFLDPS